MIDNLCFSYGGLLFFSLFILTYFMKRKIKSFRSKIFSIFILVCETFMISSTVLVYVDLNYDIEIANRIFWTLHWSFLNLGFYFLFLYLYYVGYRLNKNSLTETIKSDKYILVLTIIAAIEFICEWVVFPYDGFDAENILFLHPSTRICAFVYAALMFYIYIKTRKNLKKDEKFATLFAFVMVTLFAVLQFFFPNILFISSGVCIAILSLYYNMENTDLIILENINQINDNISNTNKHMGNYLNKMKNEINLPITNIRNDSNSLLELNVYNDDKYLELLNNIKNNSFSLLNIINNSFDTISLSINKESTLKRNYSFNDLLTKIYYYCNGKLQNKRVSLIYKIDENISSYFYGNDDRLYSAIKCLVDVCSNLTYIGRITFNISSIRNDNIEEIHISLSDTSDGIENQNIDDNLIANSEVGSVLQNIYLVKKYIESLGGTFDFSSKKGVGNKFNIVINQTISNLSPIGPFNVDNAKNINYINLSNFNIAIVDDDELNLKLIKRMINKYNNNCETYSDVKDLINNIKLDKKYDLIFMDLNMSKIDGEQALGIINNLLEGQRIPVVAITANAIAGMKEVYLSKGFADYLTKPFNKSELDSCIKKFFK